MFQLASRDTMTDQRPLLRAIFDAAVAAAHPDVVLAGHLRPAPKGRVICLAAGKGAAAMAAAAERHYLDELGLEPSRLTGIATTRHGHGVPTRRIRVVEAGHPVPDEAGLKGAERQPAAGRERRCRRSPAGAVVGRRLRQLDRAGRGRVVRAETAGDTARCCARARRSARSTPFASICRGSRAAGWRAPGSRAEIVTLAISDVPHDDPSAIASGPTVPDPTTLADARALVAKYGLPVDDAIRRALDDPRNESCKPGDAAFARARFELIAQPKASLDAAIRLAQGRGLRDHRPRRRPRRRGPRRRRRSRAGWRCRRARRRQARGDPVGRRTHRDRARQWPRRPQPGICAGAGRPAQGHARHFGAGGGYRRRRRRRRQRRRSRRRHDRFRHVREDEVARPRSRGLSRQQRRDRVLQRNRRSPADRPDADQCQRYPGDPGGLQSRCEERLFASIEPSTHPASAPSGILHDERNCARARMGSDRALARHPAAAQRRNDRALRTPARSCSAFPAARRGWRGPATR